MSHRAGTQVPACCIAKQTAFISIASNTNIISFREKLKVHNPFLPLLFYINFLLFKYKKSEEGSLLWFATEVEKCCRGQLENGSFSSFTLLL